MVRVANLRVLHVVGRLEPCGPETVLVALVAELERQQLASSVVLTPAAEADEPLLGELRRHAEAVVALKPRAKWDLRATAAIVRGTGIP